MQMSRIWGRLKRIGGSEENQAIPSEIVLCDTPTFVGRISKPQQSTLKEGDPVFTHSSQSVIPCMIISSTHFSIAIDESKPNHTTYLVRDYSRNGTFVDNMLVGTADTKEIQDGADISFRYREEVRIIYRFVVEPAPKVDHSTTVDSITQAFNQQIVTLQSEANQFEQRLQQCTEQLNETKVELEKANRKVRQEEKALTAHQETIKDLQERIRITEANAAANQARNTILQDELEDKEMELKDYKQKIHSLQDELKEKNIQLETRKHLLDDHNKLLSQEKRQRIHSEALYQELHNQVTTYEEKNIRLTTANQTLQDEIREHEIQLHSVQNRIYQQEQILEKVYKQYVPTVGTSTTNTTGRGGTSHSLFHYAENINTMIKQFKKVHQYLESKHDEEQVLLHSIQSYRQKYPVPTITTTTTTNAVTNPAIQLPSLPSTVASVYTPSHIQTITAAATAGEVFLPSLPSILSTPRHLMMDTTNNNHHRPPSIPHTPIVITQSSPAAVGGAVLRKVASFAEIVSSMDHRSSIHPPQQKPQDTPAQAQAYTHSHPPHQHPPPSHISNNFYLESTQVPFGGYDFGEELSPLLPQQPPQDQNNTSSEVMIHEVSSPIFPNGHSQAYGNVEVGKDSFFFSQDSGSMSTLGGIGGIGGIEGIGGGDRRTTELLDTSSMGIPSKEHGESSHGDSTSSHTTLSHPLLPSSSEQILLPPTAMAVVAQQQDIVLHDSSLTTSQLTPIPAHTVTTPRRLTSNNNSSSGSSSDMLSSLEIPFTASSVLPQQQQSSSKRMYEECHGTQSQTPFASPVKGAGAVGIQSTVSHVHLPDEPQGQLVDKEEEEEEEHTCTPSSEHPEGPSSSSLSGGSVEEILGEGKDWLNREEEEKELSQEANRTPMNKKARFQ